MADVTTPDAIPATNASQTTRYFNLPLFIATDKPSWLVDWNGAMGQIDSILEDISVASEGAVADVQTIQTQINALSSTVTSLEATVQTAVEDVASMQTTVDSHETRIDAVEQDLITQNNLIKTLSDTVLTMQTTLATLQSVVEGLGNTVNNLANGIIPAFGDLTFTSTSTPLEDMTDPVTLYTATGPCCVIVSLYLLTSGTAQTGDYVGLRCSINGTRVCTCIGNGPQAQAYDFSGLIKLKAGDTITVDKVGNTVMASASAIINVAPVA